MKLKGGERLPVPRSDFAANGNSPDRVNPVGRAISDGDRMPDQQSQTPSRTESDRRPHHIADEAPPEPVPEQPGVRSPVTETGLPVEDQIEKEWDPKKDGGLPTPLTDRRS